MKIVNIMIWKGMNIWEIIYVWSVYVASQFRYGILVFIGNGEISELW